MAFWVDHTEKKVKNGSINQTVLHNKKKVKTINHFISFSHQLPVDV